MTRVQNSSRSKLEAMLLNFYLKTVQTVLQARVSLTHAKENKWFSLHTPSVSRADLDPWRSAILQALDGATLPPMVLYITLPLEALSQNVVEQLLGTLPALDKTELVLEAWVLSSTAHDKETELPTFYKHAIIHFRSLFSLVHLLPVYEAFSNRHHLLHHRLGFLDTYLDNEIPLGFANQPTHAYTLAALTTPTGLLSMTVRYRNVDVLMASKPAAFEPFSSTQAEQSSTTSQKLPRQLQRNQDHSSQLLRSQSSPVLHQDGWESIRSFSTSAAIPTCSPTPPDRRRRMARPTMVSPFKSPSLTDSSLMRTAEPTSLTSWTAASEHMAAMRQPTAPSAASTPEFISSFEKRRAKPSMPRNHSFTLDTPQKDESMVDFMRMINAKPSLKMFQALSANSLADTHLWSPTSSDVSSKSGFFDTQQSFHGSKRSLQYYRSLRHDHSDFSNSMASTLATLPPPSPSASTLSTLVWHSQTSAQQDPPSH